MQVCISNIHENKDKFLIQFFSAGGILYAISQTNLFRFIAFCMVNKKYQFDQDNQDQIENTSFIMVFNLFRLLGGKEGCEAFKRFTKSIFKPVQLSCSQIVEILLLGFYIVFFIWFTQRFNFFTFWLLIVLPCVFSFLILGVYAIHYNKHNDQIDPFFKQPNIAFECPKRNEAVFLISLGILLLLFLIPFYYLRIFLISVLFVVYWIIEYILPDSERNIIVEKGTTDNVDQNQILDNMGFWIWVVLFWALFLLILFPQIPFVFILVILGLLIGFISVCMGYRRKRVNEKTRPAPLRVYFHSIYILLSIILLLYSSNNSPSRFDFISLAFIIYSSWLEVKYSFPKNIIHNSNEDTQSSFSNSHIENGVQTPNWPNEAGQNNSSDVENQSSLSNSHIPNGVQTLNRPNENVQNNSSKVENQSSFSNSHIPNDVQTLNRPNEAAQNNSSDVENQSSFSNSHIENGGQSPNRPNVNVQNIVSNSPNDEFDYINIIVYASICFLIIVGIVISVFLLIYSKSNNINTSSLGSTSGSEPICSFRLLNMSLLDYAFIASLAYRKNESISNEIRNKLDTKSITSFGSPSHVLHLEMNSNFSIFSIRGSDELIDFYVDAEMWSSSFLFSFFVPLGSLLGFTGPEYSYELGIIMSFPQFLYAKHSIVNIFFERIKESIVNLPLNHEKVFVGHSLGGGLAKLLALEFDTFGISVSGPGIKMVKSFFKGIENKSENKIIEITPEKDIVPSIDFHTGTEIRIGCDVKEPLKCHSSNLTVRTISSICNDNKYESWIK